MKKNHFIKAAGFIIRTAIALVLALGWSTADAAPAATQGAQLHKYAEAWPEKGQFTVVRKGKAYDFDAGRGKIALAIGDVIRTHRDSKVKVILEDENTLVLGSNAVMEIKPWQSGKTQGFLKGLVGSFTGWTSKEKKAPLYMQTTNATCGIRGTTFMVMINPNVTNMSILVGNGGVRPNLADLTRIPPPFSAIPPGMSLTALGNGSGNVYMNRIDTSLMNAVGAAGPVGGAAPAIPEHGDTGAGPGPGAGPRPGAAPGAPGAGPSGPGAGPGPGTGPAPLPPSAVAALPDLILSGDLDVHLNLDMDLSTGVVPQNLGLGNAPLPTFKVDRSEATVIASVSSVVREPVIAPPPGPSGINIPESTDQFVTDSVNVISVPQDGTIDTIMQQHEAPAAPLQQPGQAPGSITPGAGQTGPVSSAEPVVAPQVIPTFNPNDFINPDDIKKQNMDKARLNIKFEK